MDVNLVQMSDATHGTCVNVIMADSVEKAQEFYPDLRCLERTDECGPGWTTADGCVTFVPPSE